MKYEPCHAGRNLPRQQHEVAAHRGAFGWLCDLCWASVCRILRRELDQ